MTVPTISNLPTVPATSDTNFETEAPALFNHIKNTFVSEMNSAISFINSSTFDATVEFKNADFTAARNFLYMIDTSIGGVSVTLPANPSTGDQLLLMDQKRSFGTNNLTIGRNSQNINGAASDVVSKSTGALIRCIFESSYGWTVDLYEGEWESGTNAGDLVYNGGNVGIGTSAPNKKLHVTDSSEIVATLTNSTNDDATKTLLRFSQHTDLDSVSGTVGINRLGANAGCGFEINLADSNGAEQNRLTILENGNVGIGTSANPTGYRLDVSGGRAIVRGSTEGTLVLDDSGVADTSRPMQYISSDGGLLKLGNANRTTADGTTNSVNRLTIDSDGNVEVSTGNLVIGTAGKVGIGVTNPSAKLTINRGSDIGFILQEDTTNNHRLHMMTANNANGYYIGYAANQVEGYKLNSSGDSYFLGGDVGIGTSAPDAPLHVDSSTGNLVAKFSSSDENAYISFEDDGTTTPPLVGANDNDLLLWTNNQKRLTIDSSGNVGIGTSAPDTNLSVCQGGSVAAGRGGQVNFHGPWSGPPSNTAITSFAYIKGYKENATSGNNAGRLALGTRTHAGSLIERVTVDSSGNMAIVNGNLVLGTAGKGIDFSANSHATGMSSELLDDYEEGTFTPTYEPSSGSFTSITYNRRTGNYTKIGNTVHVWIDISTDALTLGTASGGVRISGLPFTPVNHSSGTMTAQSQWITNAPDHVYVAISTNQVWLRFLSGASYSDVTTSNLKTGTNSDANRLMGISFSYKAS